MTYGPRRWLRYNNRTAAYLSCGGAERAVFIVTSATLAAEIYSENPDYDAATLGQGLRMGWLKLYVNPELFSAEPIHKVISGIKALKSTEAVPPGFVKLLIVPKYGDHLKPRY